MVGNEMLYLVKYRICEEKVERTLYVQAESEPDAKRTAKAMALGRHKKVPFVLTNVRPHKYKHLVG